MKMMIDIKVIELIAEIEILTVKALVIATEIENAVIEVEIIEKTDTKRI